MIDIKVGDRVYMLKGNGDKVEYAVVLWVGQLPVEHVGNNRGLMAGIQFDNPVGKGNGSLGLKQYFQARAGHAAFVPASMLHKVNADSLSLFSSSYTSATPSNSESRRQFTTTSSNANNDNLIRGPGLNSPPSAAGAVSPSAMNGYHNFNGSPPGGVHGGSVQSTALSPIGTRPPITASTTAASALTSASVNREYNIFGGGHQYNGPGFMAAHGTDAKVGIGAIFTTTAGGAVGAFSSSTAAPSSGFYGGNVAYSGGKAGTANGYGPGKEEEEVFESDDDLDEALKANEGEIANVAKMMRNLPTPSSSPDNDAKPKLKAASPELKKNNNKENNNKKEANNNNSAGIKTKNAATPTSPPSSLTTASSSPPPPVAAPTASTEWSVVVSKIKKAPKQVRDQLKPPEKPAVVAVKPKTKVEKILEENPKYKSTLCSWYIQGARCPNGNVCHFAHGEHELRAIPRPKFKYKTQVCSYYAAGHCGNGSACHFAHGLADLQKNK